MTVRRLQTQEDFSVRFGGPIDDEGDIEACSRRDARQRPRTSSRPSTVRVPGVPIDLDWSGTTRGRDGRFCWGR